MLGSRPGGCFIIRANACGVLEVGDVASLGRRTVRGGSVMAQPFPWICSSCSTCSALLNLFQREHQEQNPLPECPMRSCQGELGDAGWCGWPESRSFCPLAA